jgi:hypothetical protein
LLFRVESAQKPVNSLRDGFLFDMPFGFEIRAGDTFVKFG